MSSPKHDAAPVSSLEVEDGCDLKANNEGSSAPRSRILAIALGAALLVGIVVVAVVASRSSTGSATTASSGSSGNPTVNQYNSMMQQNGALQPKSKTVDTTKFGFAATHTYTTSQAGMGGVLKYSSSWTANSSSVDIFYGYGNASIPSTELINNATYTPTNVSLFDVYAVEVFHGSKTILGCKNSNWTLILFFPKKQVSLANVVSVLRVDISDDRFNFTSVLPPSVLSQNGTILDGGVDDSGRRSRNHERISIAWSTHTMHTHELVLVGGLNFHSHVHPAMALGPFFESAFSRPLHFNGRLPRSAAHGRRLSTGPTWFKAYSASVAFGGWQFANIGVTASGASGTTSVVSGDLTVNLPLGTFFKWHFYGSYSSGAKTLVLKGSLLGLYLPILSQFITVNSLNTDLTVAPNMIGLGPVTLTGSATINTPTPLPVAINGYVYALYGQIFAFLEFNIHLSAATPRVIFCYLLPSCPAVVTTIMNDIGINSVDYYMRVAYNYQVQGTGGTAVVLLPGIYLGATITPNWAKLTWLNPIKQYISLTQTQINGGVLYTAFDKVPPPAAFIYLEFLNLKLADPKWNKALILNVLGLAYAPSAATFNVYGDLGFQYKTGQWLNFWISAFYTSGVSIFSLTASMKGLWENAFGVNGLTFGNMGATVTVDPVAVQAYGMTGELHIGAAMFKGLFLYDVTAGVLAVGGTINNLKLGDLFNWALNLTGANTTYSIAHTTTAMQNFLNGVNINQATFRFAPTAGFIGNIQFAPGYYIKLNINLWGMQLATTFGIYWRMLNIFHQNVPDLVMGFMLKNANMLGPLSAILLNPMQGWLTNAIAGKTGLCIKYPCGLSWSGISYCNKCQNIAPTNTLKAIASYNFGTVLVINQVGFSEFGLVTSLLNGQNPTVTLDVTVLGTAYKWTGQIPVSAITGTLTNFVHAVANLFVSHVAGHKTAIVSHVMKTKMCASLATDCMPKICAFGSCSPTICLKSLFVGTLC